MTADPPDSGPHRRRVAGRGRPALASRLRADVVAAGYRAGWAGLRFLPQGAVAHAFDAGAAWAAGRGGRGVQRLTENLSRVTGRPLGDPTLDRLVRAGVRSYARYWQEVFRLPAIDRDTVVGGTHCIDEHRLRAAAGSGRGVIMALPHMGNWDQAGAWAVLTGLRFTTVAERLEPAALFDRFVAFRESLGMEVIPLTGGETPPFALLEQRLRAGGMLCLLADRDLTTSGVPVQFFGATATMPAGPALLALRTGADLLPVTLWYDDPAPWNIRIHPAVQVPGRARPAPPGSAAEAEQVAALTQLVADAFAEGIAAHPTDWHMLARLWRDPADRRSGPPRPAGAAPPTPPAVPAPPVRPVPGPRRRAGRGQA